MILGKICGRYTTNQFSFQANSAAKKFEFVQVYHRDYGYVLAQIVRLVRDSEKTIAKCKVIGYKDSDGRIKPMRTPFDHDSEVLLADDEFIKDIIKLNSDKGAYVGFLDGKGIPVHLDLKKMLTKHICVLAKSGAGKSYTVGALLEEIMDKRVPLLVIDPHGEYSMMKYPSDEDKELLRKFNIKPKSYIKKIKEYGVGEDMRQLKLNNNLSGSELVHILPSKLTNSQLTLLYTAVKNLEKVNFENIMTELEMSESSSKWSVIDVIGYLNKLNIFSSAFTPYNELIQPNKCSIINFKGVDPQVQEIIVYKLLKDLFEMRKKEKIPPFFTVIEEAHNFCPERSFGEAKSSKILRTIASEGRKFGLGLCIVSQRPARVDKSVLSQITTQIILKVTNPNDLRAISNSVEGITSDSEEEVQNLPIGTSLITGIVDLPLFVNIRPRKTKHGGNAINIIEEIEQDKFFEGVDDFAKKDLLPVIKPKISINDLSIMSERKIEKVQTFLIPAVKMFCERKGATVTLLIELINGGVVKDVDEKSTIIIPNLNGLSTDELRVLESSLHLRKFDMRTLSERCKSTNMKTIISHLVQYGFLKLLDKTLDEDARFAINDNLKLLIKPQEFASYSKIEYCSLTYDKKLEPKIIIEEVKNRLNRFLNVKDHKECYILFYNVTYGDGPAEKNE